MLLKPPCLKRLTKQRASAAHRERRTGRIRRLETSSLFDEQPPRATSAHRKPPATKRFEEERQTYRARSDGRGNIPGRPRQDTPKPASPRGEDRRPRDDGPLAAKNAGQESGREDDYDTAMIGVAAGPPTRPGRRAHTYSFSRVSVSPSSFLFTFPGQGCWPHVLPFLSVLSPARGPRDDPHPWPGLEEAARVGGLSSSRTDPKGGVRAGAPPLLPHPASGIASPPPGRREVCRFVGTGRGLGLATSRSRGGRTLSFRM